MEVPNPFDKIPGDFCVIPSEYFKKILHQPVPRKNTSIFEIINYTFIGIFVFIIIIVLFGMSVECLYQETPIQKPQSRIINLNQIIEQIVEEKLKKDKEEKLKKHKEEDKEEKLKKHKEEDKEEDKEEKLKKHIEEDKEEE